MWRFEKVLGAGLLQYLTVAISHTQYGSGSKGRAKPKTWLPVIIPTRIAMAAGPLHIVLRAPLKNSTDAKGGPDSRYAILIAGLLSKGRHKEENNREVEDWVKIFILHNP